ncbi:MAG: histidine phosphatase family protein [Burkholderiales bacterium]|nr:histidine phosphatase family protein [Burkholderiales bacterium]
MALLFLVRHGQASFGTADYDRLSDLGRQQARWLGEYFAARGLTFRRAVAGSLKRQRDTASEILAAMGADLAVHEHAGLNEYHGEALYTAHTGGRDPLSHQRADYRDYWRTLKAAMAAWTEDRLAGVPETWADFGARMRAGIDLACDGLAREDAALVVSSGGAIARAMVDIIGCNGATAVEFNLQFRNSGFVELIVSGDAAARAMRLVAFNAIPHVDTPERRHAITFT